MLNFPEAILFDLGDTLLTDVSFDPLAGNKAIFKYVEKNPINVDVETIQKHAWYLDNELSEKKESSTIELSWIAFNKLLYYQFQITFTIRPEDLELEFWKHAVKQEPEPNVIFALEYIRSRGIPVGVISNTMFSSRTIKYELDRHDLATYFQFVATSADWGIRKPNPILFTTGARLINVNPHSAWYIGNSQKYDVAGAQKAGMTAVWYNRGELKGSIAQPDYTLSNWAEIEDCLVNCGRTAVSDS